MSNHLQQTQLPMDPTLANLPQIPSHITQIPAEIFEDFESALESLERYNEPLQSLQQNEWASTATNTSQLPAHHPGVLMADMGFPDMLTSAPGPYGGMAALLPDGFVGEFNYQAEWLPQGGNLPAQPGTGLDGPVPQPQAFIPAQPMPATTVTMADVMTGSSGSDATYQPVTTGEIINPAHGTAVVPAALYGPSSARTLANTAPMPPPAMARNVVMGSYMSDITFPSESRTAQGPARKRARHDRNDTSSTLPAPTTRRQPSRNGKEAQRGPPQQIRQQGAASVQATEGPTGPSSSPAGCGTMASTGGDVTRALTRLQEAMSKIKGLEALRQEDVKALKAARATLAESENARAREEAEHRETRDELGEVQKTLANLRTDLKGARSHVETLQVNQKALVDKLAHSREIIAGMVSAKTKLELPFLEQVLKDVSAYRAETGLLEGAFTRAVRLETEKLEMMQRYLDLDGQGR
ncbi:hypothetical protein BJY00DRAFT_310152 [Aspergillus carlsbadensis]|nr:hypothetical protein BJY00DRAFT_310152 [Aspergillus carlsbadensis]